MYEETINKVKAIFEGITIDEEHNKDITVYPYPLDEGETPSSYPAIVFYPDDYDNEFASTKANFKQLKYRAILMLKAEGIDNETLYLHTLPRTADKVLASVDENWNGNFIGNRRVWIQSDVGFFGVRNENEGKIAFLSMQIVVKFNLDI